MARPRTAGKCLMNLDISKRPDISHCFILIASKMPTTDKVINIFWMNEGTNKQE